MPHSPLVATAFSFISYFSKAELQNPVLEHLKNNNAVVARRRGFRKVKIFSIFRDDRDDVYE